MKVAQAIESLKTSFRQGENSFQEKECCKLEVLRAQKKL